MAYDPEYKYASKRAAIECAEIQAKRDDKPYIVKVWDSGVSWADRPDEIYSTLSFDDWLAECAEAKAPIAFCYCTHR